MAHMLAHYNEGGFTTADMAYAFDWADMASVRSGWGITEQGNALLVFNMSEGCGVSYEVTALPEGYALKQTRVESRTGRALTRTLLADTVEEALDRVSSLGAGGAPVSDMAEFPAASDEKAFDI